MKTKGLLLIVGALVVVCLGAGAAALVLLFRAQGLPLPSLRGVTLQRTAEAAACNPPAHTVPGSYQPDAVQTVGDWTVITFTAECDAPGQPRQSQGGYAAENQQGATCTSASLLPPLAAAASGPVTITVGSLGGCGGSGGPAGLSVVPGIVSGAGAVRMQALAPGGVVASAPIQAGRFVLLAPGNTPLCTLRALDANGAVLADYALDWSGTAAPPAACP